MSRTSLFRFNSTVSAISVNSVSDLIGRLKDYFECDWEPSSFDDNSPVVYWPVTLRRPTPIHAMQTFVAAALQKVGAHIVLCLDDLGTQAYTPAQFVKTVERWQQRVSPSSQFELRLFSSLLDSETEPFDAWPKMRKWLGADEKLGQVLKVAKIIQSHTGGQELIQTLETKRPRRLLTPAVVWTGLAKIQEWFSDRAVITLGGLDERPLCDAWRRVMAEAGTSVGHLYIPQLGGNSGGREPIHMEIVNLAWDSRRDIKTSLASDVRSGSHESWTASDRIIPWCIRGCISLPDFVATGCSVARRYEWSGADDNDRIVESVARALDKRLLT